MYVVDFVFILLQLSRIFTQQESSPIFSSLITIWQGVGCHDPWGFHKSTEQSQAKSDICDLTFDET